jgi:AAA domain
MLTIKTTGLSDYLDGGSGRIKVLMMGPPGSGKTRSASFWPKPLLADCEDGRMSVADRAIPYAAIKSTADMKALLTLAEEESKRPKDQQRFQTLIIDTLDAYQRIVTQEYLKANKKSQMSGWQDWGYLDAEMVNLVARLSGITMNVVCNLHVKDTKVGGSDDGDGGYLVKSPKLKGDFKDQVAAEFDLVGFMETGWEAVDGKRVLARYIQWEPSPDKPILGDRSGQLIGKTPVTFTEEDYLGLLRPMRAYMEEKLKAGVVVAEVETPEPVDPVLVTKGGPVGNVAKAATAKKTAALKPATTAAPATAQAAPSVPPVPPVTTPVPAATVPLIEPKAVPVTATEAVATVETVLGGEVVPDAVIPEPAVIEEQAVTTPVVTPEAASVPAPVADIPGNGIFTVACGQPRYTGGTAQPGLKACGQELVLDMQEDRVTGCSTPEGQIPDLIQIAGLKTRAFLCNACFAVHRNSPKK